MHRILCSKCCKIQRLQIKPIVIYNIRFSVFLSFHICHILALLGLLHRSPSGIELLSPWLSRICLCVPFISNLRRFLAPALKPACLSRHSSLVSWAAASHPFFLWALVCMIVWHDVFILKHLTCSFPGWGGPLIITSSQKEKPSTKQY